LLALPCFLIWNLAHGERRAAIERATWRLVVSKENRLAATGWELHLIDVEHGLLEHSIATNENARSEGRSVDLSGSGLSVRAELASGTLVRRRDTALREALVDPAGLLATHTTADFLGDN
jgi:hypothetical protein